MKYAASIVPFLFLGFAPGGNAQTQKSSGADDAQVQELYAQAKSAQAQGDLAGAAAKYEELLRVAPNLAAAYNNLGALYLQQREYKKAATVLEKGLKLDPKMPSASALLGISLYEMGDYANARRHLESALRANPKDNNAELFLSNDLIKTRRPRRCGCALAPAVAAPAPRAGNLVSPRQGPHETFRASSCQTKRH